jgi:RNA polymerase sigma factor (sigma-70 family)
MHEDDQELLQAYIGRGAQEAFAALVHRYIGLVYSAARRQVRSHSSAQEVTQLVFIALARKGHRLAPETPLAAWLYLVTRRTTLDFMRREARRRAYEQAAAEEFAAMKSSTPDWPLLEPWLDEAMAKLPQTDVSALLLRFFENKNLREVGAALGISEDAAQKRVSRALEQLRVVFSGKGVAVSAAGLATQLSAHAIQAVPAGLGAIVSTATVAALAAPAGGLAAVTSFKTLIMTTAQKYALAGTFALAAGFAVYEGNLLVRQRTEAAALREQAAARADEIARLRAARDAANARLALVERDIDVRLAAAQQPEAGTDAKLVAEMETRLLWFEKIDRFLADHPELATPELRFVHHGEWSRLALTKPIISEADLRQVAARLRHVGQSFVAARLDLALTLYTKTHEGKLPDTPAQLAPFLLHDRGQIGPEILERYEMLRTGNVSELPASGGEPSARRSPVRLIGPKTVADLEYDEIWWVGLRSSGVARGTDYVFGRAQEKFAQASAGRQATRADELVPYLNGSLSIAEIEKYWPRFQRSPHSGAVR